MAKAKGGKIATQRGPLNPQAPGKYIPAKQRPGTARMNTGDLQSATVGIPIKAQRPAQAGPSKTPQALRKTPLVKGRPLIPGTDAGTHNAGGASRKSSG